MATVFLWPETSEIWPVILLLSAAGALAGTIPADREVFPRTQLTAFLRQVVVTNLLRLMVWTVFLGAITVMPDEFDYRVATIFTTVVGLAIFWSRDGWMYVATKLNILVAAPERLQRIVNQTAAQMNVSVRETRLLRISFAQAYAQPANRTLVFTERMLEFMTDDEIAAICAHELGHLTESRATYYSRYIYFLMSLPWLLFKPLVHLCGAVGFILLSLNTALVPIIYRKLSHKLEKRADDIAVAHQPDAGVYARALERLHEDNLVPAVLPEERATHPHLYDRMLAAGVTPGFPRPAAPAKMAWNGTIMAMAVGALGAIIVIRLALH
jgi:Zn-dependent protease with chaperone function